MDEGSDAARASLDDESGDASRVDDERARLRISVFFDGTKNNRTNTDTRVTSPTFDAGLLQGSYENDYSNVALLSRGLRATDRHSVIYVEGIGTTDGARDDPQGFILGTGETGITGKVNAAIAQIRRLVNGSVVPVSRLIIDAFGFSRGAAAARHFVSRTLANRGLKGEPTLSSQLAEVGFTGTIEFAIVGLFDTVASFGANHEDDTHELGLDRLSLPEVRHVIHLVAAEEHRLNYSLTDITSAGKKGREILLPGVHSDVGGGYVAAGEDVKLLNLSWFAGRDVRRARLDRERQWLISRGWYTPDDLTESSMDSVLHGVRTRVKTEYANLALQLMMELSAQCTLTFNPEVKDDRFIPSDLSATYAWIQKYVGGREAPPDWVGLMAYRDLPQGFELLTKVRYEYFHFSSNYGSTGMSPQFYSESKDWEDSSENQMVGVRRRRVHEG